MERGIKGYGICHGNKERNKERKGKYALIKRREKKMEMGIIDDDGEVAGKKKNGSRSSRKERREETIKEKENIKLQAEQVERENLDCPTLTYHHCVFFLIFNNVLRMKDIRFHCDKDNPLFLGYSL